MSLKDKWLNDTTGGVMAEWVLMTAVIVTICMVGVTALQGGKAVASTAQTLSASGV